MECVFFGGAMGDGQIWIGAGSLVEYTDDYSAGAVLDAATAQFVLG